VHYAIEIGRNCEFQVLQGSVETYLKWDGESLRRYAQNFLENVAVKEFCKSV